MRIFTTQEELPFAGHPTLGTASVLKLSAPETLSGDTIKLALNVGPVPVRFKSGQPFRRDDAARSRVWRCNSIRRRSRALSGFRSMSFTPPLRPRWFRRAQHSPLSRCVRTRPWPVSESIRTRLRDICANMADAGSMFSGQRAATVQRGERACSSTAAKILQQARRQVVRSATWLVMVWSHRASIIHVRQGVEIGRASDLFLAADIISGKVGDVRVGGSTVRVAKGQLFLP